VSVRHALAHSAPSSSSLVSRPPPRSTLFPYTTLFRSRVQVQHRQRAVPAEQRQPGVPPGDRVRQVPLAPAVPLVRPHPLSGTRGDRKSTRLNSSHLGISYAVFCLKKEMRLALWRSRVG